MPGQAEPAGSRHHVSLKARRTLEVQGVVAVHSFDDAVMMLETDEGPLVVKGEQMQVMALDVEHGKLTVEGLIHSLEYAAQTAGRRARGWLRRLSR